MQRLQCRLKFCLALTTNTAASCLLAFRQIVGRICIHFRNVMSGKIQALLEGTMPQYDFLCRACKKEFTKILTLSEYEKGKIICPHCRSKEVEQRWAAFYAVTSKKS